MENRRPRLDDPKEYAIIKSIYFAKDLEKTEKLDPLENLERQDSKQRNLNKSSR